MSSAVFAEIDDVLRRPKFSRHLSNEDRREVLSLLTGAAVWIQPKAVVRDCRDVKDNIYLELAIAAEARIIVSSDKDLLDLDPWRGIRIVRPSEFLMLG